ncbi:hypothetical protein C2E23DRAFT_513183 [Lenzites betulinus]|nr:hypothetical protein C2E23DRAFT_513183 [Lenzites betulinus]
MPSTPSEASQHDNSDAESLAPRRRIHKRRTVGSDDEQDDESALSTTPSPAVIIRVKKRSKGKAKASVVSAEDSDSNQSTIQDGARPKRAKRIEWRMSRHAAARAYLGSRLEEFLATPSTQRGEFAKIVGKHVANSYEFPQHGTKDVQKAVLNWFNNHKNHSPDFSTQLTRKPAKQPSLLGRAW